MLPIYIIWFGCKYLQKYFDMIVIDRETEHAGLLPSEIAERLNGSRPVVTDTVKALERAGLLGRTPDGEDGRASACRSP
jgi:DNA-binding MarR family transcriptional regulator